MNFPIEIRHVESGLAKVFHSMQEVANFLAGKVHAEWEGWSHLGALPEPTVEPQPESAAEVAGPVGGAPERAMRAKFAVAAVQNVSDSQQNVSFRGVSGTWPYPADGADENNTYAKYSPMAEAHFAIMNPNLRDAFAVGDEFYADFTLARRAQVQPVAASTAPQSAAADAPTETVEVVITPEGAVHSDQIEGAKPMADLPAGDSLQEPSA